MTECLAIFKILDWKEVHLPEDLEIFLILPIILGWKAVHLSEGLAIFKTFGMEGIFNWIGWKCLISEGLVIYLILGWREVHLPKA